MTTTKIKQFNTMLSALKTIAHQYQTPKQLRKNSAGEYGLDYEEALEMAYENIQQLATIACKGVKIMSAE